MLAFDNRALQSLPIDPSEELRSRQVFGACFSRVRPTAVKRPRTLAVAREVAALLDLEPAFLESEEFAEVFGGNRLLPGMDSVCLLRWTPVRKLGGTARGRPRDHPRGSRQCAR
jgi:hypothetical protein